MSKLIILIVICAIAYYLQAPKTIAYVSLISKGYNFAYDSDLSIKKPPIQKDFKEVVTPIKMGNYYVTPIAEFQAAARVLGAKHYGFGREADLSPVDLALGWGAMSKDAVLNEIDIKQRNRFYYWRVDAFPIPRKEIETSSANMHFIPATKLVRKKLEQIDKDDKVKFKGYLVRIEATDGWNWVSSTTRGDTGDGACEVILLDDIKLL